MESKANLNRQTRTKKSILGRLDKNDETKVDKTGGLNNRDEPEMLDFECPVIAERLEVQGAYKHIDIVSNLNSSVVNSSQERSEYHSQQPKVKDKHQLLEMIDPPATQHNT